MRLGRRGAPASSSSAQRQALHLLDHPLGVHRVAVVDDEARPRTASGARGPCGGDPPVPPRCARPAAGARPRRAASRRARDRRRRDRASRWREYLPAPQADERALAPADRGALEPVSLGGASPKTRPRVAPRCRRLAGASVDQVDAAPGALARPSALFSLDRRRARPRAPARLGPSSSRPRRERVDRQSVAERELTASTTSPTPTLARPSSAASALAHCEHVMSARWLPPRARRRAARSPRRARPGTRTPASSPRRRGAARPARAGRLAQAAGERLRIRGERLASAHDLGPRHGCRRAARPRRCSPIRSASCGRSSPSSGFIVPTSRNRAGWETETPSRSTTLTRAPRRRAARRTRWSSSRLISST